MSDGSFSTALDRLLGDVCTPTVVRQIERGGSATALWASLSDSGFLDALVPEATGGAGLSLAEAFALFVVEGRHVLPLPMAHTMLLRALLDRSGLGAPPGPMVIAPRVRWSAAGALLCPGVPYGLVTEWVAVDHPGGWLLLPVDGAERRGSGIPGSLRADLHWPSIPAQALGSEQAVAWQEAGAAITAAQLAGAMQRVLDLTVAFANQREQFGRSIGKFQSIQHQLAVMAEQVTAARMAAEIGCSGAGPEPVALRAALAKARTSEAATFATTTSHAVHGAIGITAEFDLQLYTRRIHEWRADFGSELHWNRVLGRALLASSAGSTLDFMRQQLIPSNHEILR